MKTIKLKAVITGIRAKVDRSLGLTIATPELSTKEKALFMELQGINCEMSVKPLEGKAEDVVIDKDVNQKSQSQRIKNILYLLWKQDNEGYEEFAPYYKHKTDKIMDHYKTLIND